MRLPLCNNVPKAGEEIHTLHYNNYTHQIYICVYIYIYIERERERERKGDMPFADP